MEGVEGNPRASPGMVIGSGNGRQRTPKRQSEINLCCLCAFLLCGLLAYPTSCYSLVDSGGSAAYSKKS